jgi:DNA-binding transcriptional LysR family regulator
VESFASLVRDDHPRKGSLGTTEEFAREKHALVSAAGTGHGYQTAEMTLEEVIPPRNIACRVPMFSAAALVAKHSDCVATLPRTVAATMARDLSLHLFDCPIPLPSMEIAEYWHERYHRDPANRWLREVVRELFMRWTQNAV